MFTIFNQARQEDPMISSLRKLAIEYRQKIAQYLLGNDKHYEYTVIFFERKLSLIQQIIDKFNPSLLGHLPELISLVEAYEHAIEELFFYQDSIYDRKAKIEAELATKQEPREEQLLKIKLKICKILAAKKELELHSISILITDKLNRTNEYHITAADIPRRIESMNRYLKILEKFEREVATLDFSHPELIDNINHHLTLLQQLYFSDNVGYMYLDELTLKLTQAEDEDTKQILRWRINICNFKVATDKAFLDYLNFRLHNIIVSLKYHCSCIAKIIRLHLLVNPFIERLSLMVKTKYLLISHKRLLKDEELNEEQKIFLHKLYVCDSSRLLLYKLQAHFLFGLLIDKLDIEKFPIPDRKRYSLLIKNYKQFHEQNFGNPDKQLRAISFNLPSEFTREIYSFKSFFSEDLVEIEIPQNLPAPYAHKVVRLQPS